MVKRILAKVKLERPNAFRQQKQHNLLTMCSTICWKFDSTVKSQKIDYAVTTDRLSLQPETPLSDALSDAKIAASEPLGGGVTAARYQERTIRGGRKRRGDCGSDSLFNATTPPIRSLAEPCMTCRRLCSGMLLPPRSCSRTVNGRDCTNNCGGCDSSNIEINALGAQIRTRAL
jgi:hypothetical protein